MLENESNMHTEATNFRDVPGGLVAIWLHVPTQGRSFDPLSGTRSHVLQLKLPRAATKTWHSQINKYFLKDCGTGKKMSTVGQREPREYIQLVFYKGSKAVQWSKDSQYN